jgi:hypothetical protein
MAPAPTMTGFRCRAPTPSSAAPDVTSWGSWTFTLIAPKTPSMPARFRLSLSWRSSGARVLLWRAWRYRAQTWGSAEAIAPGRWR